MQLAHLLRALPEYKFSGAPSPGFDPGTLEITRVTDSSTAVTAGALFVAYPGVNVNGAQFIPDALERGAVAIVTESLPAHSFTLAFPLIRVPNGRSALAYLAAAWHNYPTRNLRVIGVTGTDGKTTTSTLIENILLAAGHTVGTITTVAAHIGGQEVDTGFHTTTPDAPAIQDYLAQMVERGTEYAVVESTSHGLAQHRLDAVDFDIGVVTNITHEHLDIHGSWENYRDAKALLFRALASSHRKPRTAKVSVLNADDNTRGVFDFLRQIPADEKIIYTMTSEDQPPPAPRPPTPESWISARDISHTPNGLRFTIHTPFGELSIESPLLGRYNVSNILAASGAAIGRRVPFNAISEGVKVTRGIVGRMERIDVGQPFTVIVDFAHTPNALENALKTARELVGAESPRPVSQSSGRVISVFGCAGLRDTEKRAWMGQVAGRFADLTVITAEDPRTESLSTINAQIAEGLKEENKTEGKDYFVIEDRGDAINFAINRLAQPNDVVILCGKGHERSMCYGTTEYPWSDQDSARHALASRTRKHD